MQSAYSLLVKTVIVAQRSSCLTYMDMLRHNRFCMCNQHNDRVWSYSSQHFCDANLELIASDKITPLARVEEIFFKQRNVQAALP